MAAIALTTSDSAHLALLLIAGSESLHEGSTKRLCILAGPAQDLTNLEHPISIARTEHLHEEHRANIHATKDGVDMYVHIADRASLAVSLNAKGTGSWVLSGEFGSASGKCELADSEAN